MLNLQQAHHFEREAERRYGVYDRPPYDIARVPCSYAADVVQYWKTQIVDRAASWPRSRQWMRRQALQLLDQLQHCGGSLPGYQLAPWAASRLWDTQRDLANVLDDAMWTPGHKQRRNAWSFTPGGIEDEIRATDRIIQDLSQAIYDRYRKPYMDAHEAAFEEFKEAHGRHAGAPNYEAGETEISRQQRERDMAEILERITAKSGYKTSLEDLDEKTYEPRFVKAWDRFYLEWDQWRSSNSGFLARTWIFRRTQAIEYRERALGWRKRFEAMDPARNKLASPEPTIPKEPWTEVSDRLGSWLKWGAVAAVGVAVAPPLIKALTRGSRE